MHRMIRWLTPVVALSMVLAFNRTTVRAEDKKADTGTVAGTVTGTDGKPAANVSVRIIKPPMTDGAKKGGDEAKPQANEPAAAPKGKGNRPKPVAEGKTDNDGKFSIADVPVGDYVVNAGDRASGGMGREKVSVKAGETANVSITLKARTPKQ